MVIKVALWYELWTSMMDLFWIIFLFSALITEQALILLHIDEMEEAPNKRNALASLPYDVVVKILHCLTTHSLFCYKCVYRSIAPRIASSRATTTIRCCLCQQNLVGSLSRGMPKVVDCWQTGVQATNEMVM
jgi:hypothetical protein